ncbi:MAG: hypothetical protein AAFN77_14450 [Planctomycetota bacterium]
MLFHRLKICPLSLSSIVALLLVVICGPNVEAQVEFRKSPFVESTKTESTKTADQASMVPLKKDASIELNQLLTDEQKKSSWVSNQHFADNYDRQPSRPDQRRVPALKVSSRQFQETEQNNLIDPIRAFNESLQGGPTINPDGRSNRFQDPNPGFTNGLSRPTDRIKPSPFSLKNFSMMPAESTDNNRQETPSTIEALPTPLDSTPRQSIANEQIASASDQRRRETIVENYDDGKPRLYRSVILAESGDYYDDGPWKVVDRQGNTVAEGAYRKGVMHGKWGRRHSASEGGLFATKPFTAYQGPFDSIAFFNEGKMEGQWIVYDNLRRSVFEIGYKDGRRHGSATWYYPDRSKMRTATFKEGVLDGEVLELDEDQRLVSRDRYYEGRKVVRQTTMYRPSQKKSEAYFLDAKLIPEGIDNWWDAKPTPFVSTGERVQNGPVMGWFANQQPKYRGQYKQNRPIGQFLWWHENGNRKTVGFYNENGKRNGRWIWWHPNGMKQFEGTYDEGQPIGIWRSWFDDGQLRKERDYDEEQNDPMLGLEGFGAGVMQSDSDDTTPDSEGNGANVGDLPIKTTEDDGEDSKADETESPAAPENQPGDESSNDESSDNNSESESGTGTDDGQIDIEAAESMIPQIKLDDPAKGDPERQ